MIFAARGLQFNFETAGHAPQKATRGKDVPPVGGKAIRA